jgi:hypothetical protein
VLVAEVRWSLGGRVGCQFETPVPLADYYELIAGMLAKPAQPARSNPTAASRSNK